MNHKTPIRPGKMKLSLFSHLWSTVYSLVLNHQLTPKPIPPKMTQYLAKQNKPKLVRVVPHFSFHDYTAWVMKMPPFHREPWHRKHFCRIEMRGDSGTGPTLKSCLHSREWIRYSYNIGAPILPNPSNNLIKNGFFPLVLICILFSFLPKKKKKVIKYCLFHLFQIVPIYFGYFFLAMYKFTMFMWVKTIHFALLISSKPSRLRKLPHPELVISDSQTKINLFC